MAEFQRYITRENDRWDSIAYQFYGEPLAYEQIIVANSLVPITQSLPSGIELLIPVIETEAVLTEDLPPWR